ncbi:27042_t:CDS:2 [Dentiscutata erythropus]|uniref:27042_t:CDS:1 n=1 Tax=Dentiscutata erythropus TaxID=1348616 RepID=A0A9N9HQU9_9GLOM|nr:27042_t:CDS:2 [Dentiscutata erythropus]
MALITGKFNDDPKQSPQQQSSQQQFTQQQSLYQQPTIFFTNNDEGVNPDLYPQCEAKVAELEYLAKHLREELTINNLRHIKNVVNNIDRVFTMINDIKSSQCNSKCTNTWNVKPWTMFL